MTRCVVVLAWVVVACGADFAYNQRYEECDDHHAKYAAKLCEAQLGPVLSVPHISQCRTIRLKIPHFDEWSAKECIGPMLAGDKDVLAGGGLYVREVVRTQTGEGISSTCLHYACVSTTHYKPFELFQSVLDLKSWNRRKRAGMPGIMQRFDLVDYQNCVKQIKLSDQYWGLAQIKAVVYANPEPKKLFKSLTKKKLFDEDIVKYVSEWNRLTVNTAIAHSKNQDDLTDHYRVDLNECMQYDQLSNYRLHLSSENMVELIDRFEFLSRLNNKILSESDEMKVEDFVDAEGKTWQIVFFENYKFSQKMLDEEHWKLLRQFNGKHPGVVEADGGSWRIPYEIFMSQYKSTLNYAAPEKSREMTKLYQVRRFDLTLTDFCLPCNWQEKMSAHIEQMLKLFAEQGEDITVGYLGTMKQRDGLHDYYDVDVNAYAQFKGDWKNSLNVEYNLTKRLVESLIGKKSWLYAENDGISMEIYQLIDPSIGECSTSAGALYKKLMDKTCERFERGQKLEKELDEIGEKNKAYYEKIYDRCDNLNLAGVGRPFDPHWGQLDVQEESNYDELLKSGSLKDVIFKYDTGAGQLYLYGRLPEPGPVPWKDLSSSELNRMTEDFSKLI